LKKQFSIEVYANFINTLLSRGFAVVEIPRELKGGEASLNYFPYPFLLNEGVEEGGSPLYF